MALLPDRFARLLALEPVDEDAWLAPTPDVEGPGRLFGGQVASQSLRAATLTVDGGRRAHSFHAYFIRPGRPGTPLRLEVDRTRDGRSFTTRRVTASQEDEPIFTLEASFHIDEPGDDWQEPAAMDVPPPEDSGAAEGFLAHFDARSPVEIRSVRPWEPGAPVHPFWVRARTGLPDDVGLHASVLAFMSDMAVVAGARAPTAARPMEFVAASLDHAVWIHRPERVDQWLLFSVVPMTNFGARGLAHGTFHTEAGVLVATVMQEALLRGTGNFYFPER
jgi:acyl-CoA thioesterase-2